MPALEEAHQEITSLVAKYQSLDEKAVRKYTEADTRRVFILPLFKAMGWDVYSREEVTEEERASGGRVDYAFKLRGVSQFYLEAKALRADLNKLEYAKQVVTYAYNKGVTWAVLTDFESLKVFNAQTGRLCLNLSCRDYLPDFSELWLLSRESFEKNALNEWAEKHGVLPPRLGIEQRLYNQLRQWREELYTQLYHYNRHLTFDQIDEVIQRLFNRLIFIRTCEDRRIEERVLLSALHEWRSSGRKGELIEVLRQIFRHFDGYYDSDLFLLHLTDQIFIESTTVESIINGLYDVPGTMASYDFSVIDANVLGAVYEQYLGHVAIVVKQRVKEAQARMDLGFPSEPIFEVTAKRQRRKEQGIYYTPRFVTDYIVKETVGRFRQERSYDEVCKIKILDPACGSGSFLIRAYDELLNYHADKRGKAVAELDQWERLPTLTGNIFGVDLDIQAVEIARLNLLLRSLARREVLPSLASNICQGNSLISGTEEELRPYFGDAWRDKKPFNWEREFKDIMAQGGFDVVIGNPPYYNVETLGKGAADVAFLQDAFKQIWMDKSDILFYFLARAIELSKGYISFIISRSFLESDKAVKLRGYILNKCFVKALIDFREFKVFEPEADIATCILVLSKKDPGIDAHKNFIRVAQVLKWNGSKAELMQHIESYLPGNETYANEYIRVFTADQATLSSEPWNLAPPIFVRVCDKIDANHPKLRDVCIVGSGMQTACNDVFGKIWDEQIKDEGLERKYLKKRAANSDVQKYAIYHSGEYLIYVEDVPAFEECPPCIAQHLLINRGKLESRAAYKRGDCKWFKYSFPMHKEHYHKPKLIVPYRAGFNRFALDENAEYISLTDTTVVFPREDRAINLKYLLGILNSQLMNFRYRYIGKLTSKGMYEYFENGIGKLPIQRIDFGDPAEKKRHDDLVALVDRMLELNKRLAPTRNTPCNERDELLREIERTDQEIDNLVYDLYGLTEEERKIVEGV
jgi:type I restriction-modification system DNA methylase subunit